MQARRLWPAPSGSLASTAHVGTVPPPAAQAPLVPSGTPVVNALAKQRAMLENVFRACVGLPPENNMMLVGAACGWEWVGQAGQPWPWRVDPGAEPAARCDALVL